MNEKIASELNRVAKRLVSAKDQWYLKYVNGGRSLSITRRFSLDDNLEYSGSLLLAINSEFDEIYDVGRSCGFVNGGVTFHTNRRPLEYQMVLNYTGGSLSEEVESDRDLRRFFDFLRDEFGAVVK